MTENPLEAMSRVKERLEAPADLLIQPVVIFENEFTHEGLPRTLGDVKVRAVGATNRETLSVLRRLGEDEASVFHEFAVTEAFKSFTNSTIVNEEEIFEVIQTKEFEAYFKNDVEPVSIELSIDVAATMDVADEHVVEIRVDAPSYEAAVIGFIEVTSDTNLTNILKETIGIQ